MHCIYGFYAHRHTLRKAGGLIGGSFKLVDINFILKLASVLFSRSVKTQQGRKVQEGNKYPSVANVDAQGYRVNGELLPYSIQRIFRASACTCKSNLSL